MTLPSTISAFELAVIRSYGRTGKVAVIADINSTTQETILGILDDHSIAGSGSEPDRAAAKALAVQIQAGLDDGTITECPTPAHINATPVVERIDVTPTIAPPKPAPTTPLAADLLANAPAGSVLAAIADLLARAATDPTSRAIADRIRSDDDTLADLARLEAASSARGQLDTFAGKAMELAMRLRETAIRLAAYGTGEHVEAWASGVGLSVPLDVEGVAAYIEAHPLVA